MELLLIVGGLVLLAGLIGAWWWQRKQPRKGSGGGKPRAMDGLDTTMAWHPQSTRIMTAPERKAFAALREGLPEYIILAQVPLARFLKVPTRHSYSEWLRRVGVLCADLVVCDNVSQVVAIVDIRAPESQENDRARQRHARMDRVLKAADIPLHVWREDALPNAIGARKAILKDQADAPAPRAAAGMQVTRTTAVLSDRNGVAVVVAEETSEQREPPSSTWFDDMDSAPMPLNPLPPRGSGPSIR